MPALNLRRASQAVKLQTNADAPGMRKKMRQNTGTAMLQF
jgi:hypothetical protein